MKEFAYVNGTILPAENATIGINDLALLRGYGIFDFFRAIDGKLIYLEDHLDRFENSLKLMHLALPVSREHLRENIRELARLNAAPTLGIKLIATGGYSPDGYAPADSINLIMTAKPFSITPFEKGTRLMWVEHRRDLWEIKTTNYTHAITQLPKLKAAGADDVLFHAKGLVSESSRSNFFIVKNGVLVTADDFILRGITRKHIFRLAAQIMPVEERPLTVEEVLAADECFITGSTKRVMPVLSVNEKNYAVGNFTRRLYDLLLENENL
jgi:branched-chain amino acid aminotransferase